MGDQPVARPLPAHRTAERKNKRTQISCLEWDSNPRTHDPSVRVGRRQFMSYTARPATVIGSYCVHCYKMSSDYSGTISVLKSDVTDLYAGIIQPFKVQWLYTCTSIYHLCNPQNVFLRFLGFSQYTAIVSLYGINRLIFVAETYCVSCDVRAEFIYIN
jgi:hypothetical protein